MANKFSKLLDDVAKDREKAANRELWDKKPVNPTESKTIVASTPLKSDYKRPVVENSPMNERLPDVKEIPMETLLSTLDAIIHFDPIVIQNSETGCVQLYELTPEQRQSIKTVKIREEFQKGEKTGEVIEIQFWDKLGAVELAAKLQKMLNDKVQTNNLVIITDRLQRAKQRMKTVKETTKSTPQLRSPEMDAAFESIDDNLDSLEKELDL